MIRALRHIHMSPADADVLGLKNHDTVAAVVAAGGRRLIFGDIVVRVSPAFTIELHLDSDEGNAAGLQSGTEVMLTDDPTERSRISLGDITYGAPSSERRAWVDRRDGRSAACSD